jgi:hypothetical protein
MEAIRSRLATFSLARAVLAAAIWIAAALGGFAHAGAARADGTDFGMGAVQSGDTRNASEKFIFMFEPSARWAQTLHWKYNHANAPQALASFKPSVIAQLQASLNKWSSQCAVTYQYDGETAVAPGTQVSGQPDLVNVVGWGAVDPSVSAYTYDWYADSGNTRTLIDADMTLDPAKIATIGDLDRVATHEWGHALGLNHSDDATAIMAGPPYTAYNTLANPQPDDLRGCRCLYGVPAGVQAPYICSLQHQLDFGTQSVGVMSAPQAVTFTNSGNAPLLIQSANTRDAQFVRVSGCDPGSSVPAGASCTMQLAVNPNGAGQMSSRLEVYTNDGFYSVSLVAIGKSEMLEQRSVQAVDVIEYYNATLDHYFVTHLPAEIANLDAGLTPTRWTRTGQSFKAYLTPQADTSQVCRFYIPPKEGSSHWFGRSAAECNAAQQAHPDFVLEDPNFMQLYVPSGGVCPAGAVPVYRVFDNRPDANHRYTTDRATRDRMVAQGWIAEGDGPDLVVMCAPR